MNAASGPLRRLLPMPGYTISAFVLLAMVGAPEAFPQYFDFSAMRNTPRAALAPLIGILYGMLRVLRFHPAANPAYMEWLLVTPWSPGRRLPLGPVHLVVGDAIAIGALSALMWGRENWWAVPLVAVVSYLCTLSALLRATAPAFALLVIAGLAATARVMVWPRAVPVVLAGTYAVGWLGLVRSMRAFPWPPRVPRPDQIGLRPRLVVVENTASKQRTRFLAGWPHTALAPAATARGRPRLRVGAAVTAMWVAWCVVSVVEAYGADDETRWGLHLVLLIVIGIAVAVRIGIYCNGYPTPLGLIGRIATGRLILPRYDVVFVTPLAASGAALLVLWAGSAIGSPDSFRGAVALLVLLLILLLGGPSLASWRLTGGHRIQPTAVSSSKGEVVEA